MDVAVFGKRENIRGQYLTRTGREGAEKSSDFHNVLKSSLGQDRTGGVPYGYLAKDGVITYNGVTFVCDYEKNSICLGDVSDPKKTLCITLSGGGQLKVNRGEIGTLAKAIGMFSPEDVALIMRAIALDAKCQQELNKIEELEGSPDHIVQKQEA